MRNVNFLNLNTYPQVNFPHDISDNPFKDGWYHYFDKENKNIYEIVDVMYGEILRISHYFRPFRLKYHGKKHFGLG